MSASAQRIQLRPKSVKTGIDQPAGVCSGITFFADNTEQTDTEQIRRAPRRPIASPLFKTYRYPAHCSRHFSADLWAAELQDHAIGILQLNAPSPSRNGTAGSDRAVSAFNRNRPFQIEGVSDQLSCRVSDP